MSRLRRFLHIEGVRRDRAEASGDAPATTRPLAPGRFGLPPRPEPVSPAGSTPEPSGKPSSLTPEQSAWVREQLRKDWENSLLTRMDDGVERLADAILSRIPPGARTSVRYAALGLAAVLLVIGLMGRGFGPRVACLAGAVALGFVFGPPSLRRP